MIHLLNYKGEIIDFISQKEDVVIETSMNRQTKENVEVFDFTLLSERAEGFNERNRIIVQDRNNEYREFIVTSVTESNDGTTEIESQASYIEDISKAKPFKPGKLEKMTASQALLAVLVDTGWEPSEETEWDGIRTTTWSEYKTPYDVLQQLVTTYKMVLDFKVKLGSNSVEKREVSLKKPNPLFNGKEITHGKDLDTFQRVSDFSEVNTALLAIGPEREDGSRLEIVVVDNEAQSQFGLNRRYIWGLYEPESEDQDMTEARLRTLATTELNKRKTQAVSYEVSSINLLEHFPHEIVRLGDIVRIKDRTFNPPLYAEAEVIGEEYDAISDTSVYTFGQVVEYKESSLRKYFLDRLDSFTKKANDNINGQINIITDRIDEEVEKLQQKIHRGAEPPANPQDGDFWYDTTNPKVAVLREYKNGQWQNASAHDVEQIGGLRREAIIYRQLMESTQYLSVDVSIIYERANKDLTSEYLVDLEIKNKLNDALTILLTKLQNVQNFIDSMTEETATIGSLMDWQSAIIDLREAHIYLGYVLLEAEEAMDKRFKLLQSQYSDEKFQEAMDKVADVIGGTFNPDTGELIADIPNKEMLEALEKEVKDSLADLTQENATKLQELQNGITETNQRITNTKEELSAGITSVTKKVDGLQVGGRNLLLDSANISKAIDYTQGNYNQYFSVQITPLHEHFKKGDFITISFDVQMERGDYLSIYDNNQHWDYRFGSKTFTNIGTEKQRLTATFELIEPTKTTSTWQLAFYNNNNGDRFTIEKIKIEKGNVATAWTPAPEDAEAAIGNVRATVETQSSDIKVLKDGIKLKADNTEVTKIYDNYLTPLQTQVNAQKATLDVLPSQIAAKVSQSTYTADMNNIVGRLNSADSARTQLSNEIKDRVTLNEYNNMKIGTRNLVANSDFKDGMLNWRNVGNTTPANSIDSTQTDLPNGFKNVAIVESTNTTSYEKGIAQNNLVLEAGKEYVLSAWIKILSGGTRVRLQEGRNKFTNTTFDASTEWQRYEFKFTAYEALTNIYLVTPKNTANNKFAVTGFQVVEGNKNTDWKPSDIDTDQRLSTMETSISQNGQDILLRAKNEDLNKTKQTLSKIAAEILVNTTTGITLKYDENGTVNDVVVGSGGVKINASKFEINNGDVTVKDGITTIKDAYIDKLFAKQATINYLNSVDITAKRIQAKDAKAEVNIENGTITMNRTDGYKLDIGMNGITMQNPNGSTRFTMNTTYVQSAALGTTNSNVYLAAQPGYEARVVDVTQIPSDGAWDSYNYVPLRADSFIGDKLMTNRGTNLYLGTDSEVRITSRGGYAGTDTVYRKVRALGYFGDFFDTNSVTNGVHIYIRPDSDAEVRFTSRGTTDNYVDIRAKNVYGSALVTRDSGNLYLGTDDGVRITGRSLYNGGSPIWRTLAASGLYGNFVNANPNMNGTHLYLRPTGGEVRITANNSTDTYVDVRARKFIENSHEKYKKDITPWNYDALSVLVNETQVYQYKFKNESEERDYFTRGFVVGDGYDTPIEFTNKDGVSTYEITAWSIRAIQQLHDMIEAQAEEIKALKSKEVKTNEQ